MPVFHSFDDIGDLRTKEGQEIMRARWRTRLAALVLIIGAWPLVSPTIPSAGASPEADFVAVNPRGESVPVEREGDTFVFSSDLFSLTTLAKIGTFTDRAKCSTSAPPPCAVYDVTSTFGLTDGEIVTHNQWSVTPDPTRPSVVFSASRPERDTIVSGTGRFAGRTGRMSGWGLVDLSQFPAKLSFDDRDFIRFDPTDAGVLGHRELVLAHRASGTDSFVTELFRSAGVNESKDPTRFVIHTPLLSLSDGSQLGTVTDTFTCAAGPPPCLVLDVTPVLQYPDGTVTVHTDVPLAPDPTRPGFYLFGTRPTRDNIVSATGAYTGRTGRLSVSGEVDLRRFPSPIPYEGVGVLIFTR
jgi:hypothetical protein